MRSEDRTRISTSASRLTQLEDEAAAERERRNGMIREVIEGGATYRATARAAGLSVGTVARIVAHDQA